MKTSQEQNSQPDHVDIGLIRDNLQLTYEERIAQHQDTIDCISVLNQIGSAHRARSAKSSQISSQDAS